MNEISNKFLLTGDKLMVELHSDNHDLLKGLVHHLLNIVKGLKNLNKQII